MSEFEEQGFGICRADELQANGQIVFGKAAGYGDRRHTGEIRGAIEAK